MFFNASVTAVVWCNFQLVEGDQRIVAQHAGFTITEAWGP